MNWTIPRPKPTAYPQPDSGVLRRQGRLPYRGLGSGVPRALRSWPEIDLTDDRDRRLFIATIHRKILPGF